mmetsp:Transcript_224/g.647  ORF Transcript_224/g.647 Transcript_224/m.647 type:complete len:276 (+) Transcript_224:1760-2587(+)
MRLRSPFSSRFFPLVRSILHRHSTSSCLGLFTSPTSLTMHSCMMRSVSIFLLYSCPMNWILPSIRCRALYSLAASRASSILMRCLACAGVSFGFSVSISPSSLSSPSGLAADLASSSLFSASPSAAASSSSSSSSVSPEAFFSAAAFSRASTAFIALSPASNSSWHLLSSTRRKVMFSFLAPSVAGASGSSKPGSLAFSCTHSSAYSSVKVTSVSALSKIRSMRPRRVLAEVTPTSTSLPRMRSKLSGVSLFSCALNSFCFFSSSGSSVRVAPIL